MLERSPCPWHALACSSVSHDIEAETRQAVAISNVTEGSFRQRYSLEFQSFSIASEGGTVRVGVGLTNVSPGDLQGVLRGYANDTLGNAISSASTNITAAAGSPVSANLAFPGTENISSRFLQFTFVVLAPNGTALSPRDHEDGPDCPVFGFPMTPPVEASFGALHTLETNVTNVAPFQVTLVIVGQIQNSDNEAVAVTSSTLTIGAGQTSTGYLALIGLTCGSYEVQISDYLLAPSPLPPDTPQLSPGSFDVPTSVC